MQNGLAIFTNKLLFTVILVHRIESLPKDKILQIYCNKMDLPLEKFTCSWINVLDITNTSNGLANKPTAKNEWNETSSY